MRIALFIAVAIAAAASPPEGRASLAFLFDQTKAGPNDRVTVRTGATPTGFTPVRRGRLTRLYLVPDALASDVHSRYDRRLEFIGVLLRDGRSRGTLTFSVPPLDAGDYTLAYWCPDCARYDRGTTFFVQDVWDWVEPYRSQAMLHLEASAGCPVTIPNGSRPPGLRQLAPGWNFHGNGVLGTRMPNDGLQPSPRPDGSFGAKILWSARVGGTFSVVYRRLDATGPTLRARTSTGGPPWFSQLSFTEGCWRITARVRDISLTIAVKVAPP